MSEPVRIVTHNGKFHSDDVFGVATLKCIFETGEVARTRDEELIRSADIVLDVGGIYDEETNRFDHHQIGGAGERPNGIPYASFGLIWKKYGPEICKDPKIAEKIDQILVQSIDAGDNGVSTYAATIEGAFPYTTHSIVDLFRPTPSEPEEYDASFMRAVEWAHWVIIRQIKLTADTMDAEDIIRRGYESAADKQIIIFDKDNVYGRGITGRELMKYPEPLFAVIYRKDADSWQLVAVPTEEHSFDRRKFLPEAWGGRKDEELAHITGVPDAIFCHRGLFMAVTKSKEGAIKLAQLALES